MWSALPAVSLDNLIVQGPIERGLYVARSPSHLAPVVMKKIVELLDSEHDAENPKMETPPTKLAYAPTRYWRRNSRIGQLIWVDSGNVFDPYLISVEARKRRLDPTRVLRTIKVGRPFTAFQFQQMLEHIPNPRLWAPQVGGPHNADIFRKENIPPVSNFEFQKTSNEAAIRNSKIEERISRREMSLHNSQAMWWTPLVVISDLMGLFYDPDLPDDALIRAYRSFLIRLSFLRQRAIVLALSLDYQVPAGREHLLPEILKMARRVYATPELAMHANVA